MEETWAPNIWRPPRARESQENGTTAASTQKRAEESPEGVIRQPQYRRQEIQGPPSQGPAKPGGHHYPQKGDQRQTPELNPLHSGVETGRPPQSPAAAEKTTSPDPNWMASSSSQPPAPDREQRTENREQGCEKDPMLHLTRSNVVLEATRRKRSPNSPASQRHTCTPKPYLYVDVMERERGSIRDGEESIGGGKVPPPFGASSPADPHRQPRCPKSAPWQPGAAHQTPQQRKNYPHPIIQSTPRLLKTIDTQLKRPPDPPTHRRPPHQGQAQAHAPTHAPGGTPTRTQAPQAQPEFQPGGRAPPEPQAPPGPTPEQYGRQAGNLRPPAQASPAAPRAAARKTAPESHQHPIQARTAAPAPNPPRNPPLGNSQMPQAHLPPPRQQQRPKLDRIMTPTHTR
ncbi:basic salivary proline-rich protein 2-like [Labeo rohita]|uniref:basic salivary proline-rich protein 2-like n=1 Tax=Labeo rohita TaxID=84645 RepID=UPI0021E2184D|nr:basic salivary proline-rich protein 2-like [Labeo rohita]